MTATMRNYGLVLPKNYVSIEKDEMEYIDGGWCNSYVLAAKDASALLAGLMSAYWLMAAGYTYCA